MAISDFVDSMRSISFQETDFAAKTWIIDSKWT